MRSRSMLLKSGLVVMLFALVFTLGCGGGGSSSSSGAAGGGNVVQGVAAGGAPIVGKVYLKDSAGSAEKSTAIGIDGSYSIDVTGLTAPFILKADGTVNGTPYTLYSAATAAGVTANVNPITNIAVASAGGENDPAAVYSDPKGHAANITNKISTEVQKIVDNVIAKLDTTQFAGAKDIDPMKGTFKANGTGLDKVLDYVDFKVNTSYGTVTVTDKVNKTVIAAATTTGTGTGMGLSSLSVSSANATALATTVSSGTKPISALTVAEKVSVLDAKDATATKAKMRVQKVGLLQLAPSDISDKSAQFFTDETNVYVADRTSDAFDTVNEILCSIAQTKYDEMLNVKSAKGADANGNYKVQVDKNKCSKSQDSASQAGQDSQNQSSGANAPDYEVWKINSSRASADAHQIVQAWIHQKGSGDGEPAKLIVAKLDISEGKSDTNPYGIFTINFKAYPRKQDGTYDSTVMMKGFLKTERNSSGKVVFSFISDGGFSLGGGSTASFTQKAAFERTADGSGGDGTISNSETSPDTMMQPKSETFNIAFNSNYFERTDGSNNTVCLSRTNPLITVWRYGLYDSAGNRVIRHSGFPIRYNDGTKDYYGWIGYWGMWFPDSVTVPNGSTVYKTDYTKTGPVETQYSVIVAGGRLKKHTRSTLNLSAVTGVPMDYFNNSDQKNYRVKWDGHNFNIVGYLDQTTNMWTDTTGKIDLTTLNSTDLNFWSQSLGGQVRVKLDGCSQNAPQMGQPPTFSSCSASDTSSVVFYSEDIVYPSDTVPATLACLNNCPDPTNITNTNPFFDTSSMQMQQVAPAQAQFKSYTFDKGSMLLKYGTNSVVLTGQNTSQQWGVMSGPLFDPNTTNLGKLACDFNTSYTCGWKAWSDLDTFYTWETGPDQWNHFTALVDSNSNVVKFDPPLEVTYVDASSGATYNLDYNGFGDLGGIPGTCVSWDTGQPVSCGPNTRWIPQFSISEGTSVSAKDSSGNTVYYLVKPLDEEQRMSGATTDTCTNAGLTTTAYTLPDIANWVDPGATSDTNRVDADNEPKGLGAPAVIAGIVQTPNSTPSSRSLSAMVKTSLSSMWDSVTSYFK